jgi:3-deoxy-D-manno-octulosonic acid kinase
LKPAAIVKQRQIKTFQQAPVFAEYDANLVAEFSTDLFDSAYWQQQNAVMGSAQGRGTTWFVKQQDQQWVLRHYYRGGLVGKLIHDSYLFTRHDNTRAAKEFHLLRQLQALQLPVPAPIAYQVVQKGFSYRADIITARICDAQDLVAVVGERALPAELWRDIGATIKAFHQHGIYHHDLNAHNILLDAQQKVWLIDFDRGEQRVVSTTWQQKNLARLLRSLRKEQGKNSHWHWCEQDWQALLCGYHAS